MNRINLHFYKQTIKTSSFPTWATLTTPNPAARSCSSPFLRGVPLAYIHPPGRRSSSTPGSGVTGESQPRSSSSFTLSLPGKPPERLPRGVCVEGGHRAGSSPLLAAGSGLPTMGLGARSTSPPCFPRSPSLSIPPPGVTHPPHSPSRSSLCCRGVMVVVWCVWGGGDRAGPHPAAPPSLSRAPGQPEGLLLAALTPPPPPPPVPAPAPAPAARMP